MATASGVRVAHRLDTTLPVLTQPGTDIAMAYVLNDGLQSNVSLDTGMAPPGALGSAKYSVLNSHSTSSGNIAIRWVTPFVSGDTAYFSYLIRAPIEYVYQQWGVGFGPAHKLSIFSDGPTPSNGSIGSNQAFEVVIQSNNNRGDISGYNQDGSAYPPWDRGFSPAWGFDIKRQPSIDHGASPLTGNDPDTGSAWTAQQQGRAEFAGLYATETLEPFVKGYGDPLDGAFRQAPDQWIRIHGRVGIGTAYVANTHITVWAEIQGQAPTLLLDLTDCTLGGTPHYTTLWPVPYTSQRSPGGRHVSSFGTAVGGVTPVLCSLGNALGDGTLEYVASTGKLRYHSANDGFGAAHAFSSANSVNLINLKGDKDGTITTTTGSNTLPVSSLALTDASLFPTSGSVVVGMPDTTSPDQSHGYGEQRVEYTGKSSNTLTGCTGGTGTHNSGSNVRITSAITLRLDNAVSLPSSGTTTMAVTIADGRKDTQVWYADAIVSSQPIKTRDGYTPTTTSSALATAAAGMSANSWLNFTSPTGIDYALANTATAGEYNYTYAASGSICHYGNKCAWNHLSRKIQVVGGDHYSNLDAVQRYVEYDDASNAWTRTMPDDGLRVILAGVRHANDGTCINPYTGDLYHLVFKANYEVPTSNFFVRKLAYGASAFTSQTPIPVLFFEQNPIGACWWSGSFSGAGAQGAYVIFNSGDSTSGGATTDGGIYAYDPLSDSVIFSAQSMFPNYDSGGSGVTLNSVIAYSPVYNCAVYGGGAGGTSPKQGRQIRRLNSDHTSTALTDFPGAGKFGIQTGNLCVDPVTGKFVVLSQGEMWELDPSSTGTWTQLTSPPGGSGGALDPGYNPNPHGILSCAIPDYGVVAYLSSTGNTGATMYLYKR